MADQQQPETKVKFVKKKGGHAAAHGGAWKVAYADLVTANFWKPALAECEARFAAQD